MGFFSSLFGDSSPTTTNESRSNAQQSNYAVTALPDWQMAYLQPQLARVAGMAPPQYYGGALTAGRSPLSGMAERMAYDRAAAGSPALRAAQDHARSLMSGAYLNANPHLDAMYGNAAARAQQSFADATLPSIASMFSRAGRYGSGAMGAQVDRAQQTLGDTLGRLASDVYGQNYARERAAMDAAIAQAPALAAADYASTDALARHGASADAYNQGAIDREIQRYQFNQLAPWQYEQQRLAMLAGDYGGRSTTTTGNSSSYGTQSQTGPETGFFSRLFGPMAAAFGTGFAGQLGRRAAGRNP